jgi:uncharacterized membrane protein
MNPLTSIKGVWIAGVILSLILIVPVSLVSGSGVFDLGPLTVLRWVHIVAGIVWVGLLYYFNFVQMPAVAAAVAAKSGPGPAAIAKFVVPRALIWFRWASVVTWGAGACYLVGTGQLLNAFSLGLLGGGDPRYGLSMGIGAWLGTVLLINVWLVIWPHQKKILGLAQTKGDADLARSKQTVARFARINAVLSLPMLLFMVVASHGLAT